MSDNDRFDLDYELDEIEDKLNDLSDEEKEYGRYISDDLEILSDYFDLMYDNGLTKAEFNKYKAQCMKRIETKHYRSSSMLNSKSLKFAHSLMKSGCLTKDEYEMIKSRIDQLPEEHKQRRIKAENARKTKLVMTNLWEVFKFVIWILLIPFRILWYFLEIFAYGWDKVAERDLLEDAMRRVKDEDD